MWILMRNKSWFANYKIDRKCYKRKLTIFMSGSKLITLIDGALVNRPAETRWCSLGTHEPDLDNASVGRVHFVEELKF